MERAVSDDDATGTRVLKALPVKADGVKAEQEEATALSEATVTRANFILRDLLLLVRKSERRLKRVAVVVLDRVFFFQRMMANQNTTAVKENGGSYR
jgi:hypothetical protein